MKKKGEGKVRQGNLDILTYIREEISFSSLQFCILTFPFPYPFILPFSLTFPFPSYSLLFHFPVPFLFHSHSLPILPSSIAFPSSLTLPFFPLPLPFFPSPSLLPHLIFSEAISTHQFSLALYYLILPIINIPAPPT